MSLQLEIGSSESELLNNKMNQLLQHILGFCNQEYQILYGTNDIAELLSGCVKPE